MAPRQRKPQPQAAKAPKAPKAPRAPAVQPAKGYAVTIDGVIDVTTVYTTARGATVNWLVTHGVSVTAMWSDGMIAAAFAQAQKRVEQKLDLVPLILRRRQE